MTLSHEEKIARLQLIRTEGIGPKLFHHLLTRYESGLEALEALPDRAKEYYLTTPLRMPNVQKIEQELEILEKHRATMVFSGEENYPKALTQLHDYPPIISCMGNLSVINKEMISIVGARFSSVNGCLFAKDLSKTLSRQGFAVVSGLARGIDTSAHQGALSRGTIAVVAGGLGHLYPPENRALAEDICQDGLIISEMPYDMSPKSMLFPRRNRIIAALGKGTVVIEAGKRSGSLITAKMALELGKDVFAVPGFPLDPRCAGTNELIKNGANLIENAEDILSHYDIELNQIEMIPEPKQHAMSDHMQAYHIIKPLLSATPTEVDYVILESGLSSQLVMSVLSEMELAGTVTRSAGGKVALCYA